MPLSAAQITRVRQMSAERATANYLDGDIQVLADATSRTIDSDGYAPSHASYTDTYDLYLLAAEIWRTKAGEVADEFDFSAEGGEFTRSQKYDNYMKMAARYSGMAAFKSTSTA